MYFSSELSSSCKVQASLYVSGDVMCSDMCLLSRLLLLLLAPLVPLVPLPHPELLPLLLSWSEFVSEI